ncbi:hypothetical protein [Streptomyces spiramyceticus]|nr:hypothetical protein [Streptomyces spiramyceticus]
MDGDVVKEATLVVRTGNAVVELHHSGAGFAGAATPRRRDDHEGGDDGG